MMSPLAQTWWCLLGAAAAGVPLVFFTAPPREPAAVPRPAQVESGQGVALAATLRCSGAPQRVQLWHEGRMVAELAPQEGLWQGELRLAVPALPPVLELEVLVQWPGSGEGAQGITLELAPPKLPARKDTQWTPPASNELHDILTYQW